MDKFVTMEKNGERIEVHPDGVAQHKQLGWQVVEEDSPPQTALESESNEAQRSAQQVKPRKGK